MASPGLPPQLGSCLESHLEKGPTLHRSAWELGLFLTLRRGMKMLAILGAALPQVSPGPTQVHQLSLGVFNLPRLCVSAALPSV